MNLINLEYINEKDKNLVQTFITNNATKKYILGINKLTKSVQKLVKVDGIIDDFTRVQHSRKKEIFKIENVPKDALILSTATGSPLEVKRRLDEMGFNNISYLALCKYSKLDLIDPPFIMDFKADFSQNRQRYKNTFNLLADTKSKEIFTKLINFKISFDYSFMHGFTNDHEGQYFDKEILPPFKNISFLDGGGYVGDTASEVIKNYPDFKKLYIIEPIPENIRIAKRELGKFENIDIVTP